MESNPKSSSASHSEPEGISNSAEEGKEEKIKKPTTKAKSFKKIANGAKSSIVSKAKDGSEQMQKLKKSASVVRGLRTSVNLRPKGPSGQLVKHSDDPNANNPAILCAEASELVAAALRTDDNLENTIGNSLQRKTEQRDAPKRGGVEVSCFKDLLRALNVCKDKVRNKQLDDQIGRKYTPKPLKERAFEIWKQVDRNGDGVLDFKEVKRVFEYLHIRVPDSKIQQFIDKFDEDNNGRLEFHEFFNMYQAIHSVPNMKQEFLLAIVLGSSEEAIRPVAEGKKSISDLTLGPKDLMAFIAWATDSTQKPDEVQCAYRLYQLVKDDGLSGDVDPFGDWDVPETAPLTMEEPASGSAIPHAATANTLKTLDQILMETSSQRPTLQPEGSDATIWESQCGSPRNSISSSPDHLMGERPRFDTDNNQAGDNATRQRCASDALAEYGSGTFDQETKQMNRHMSRGAAPIPNVPALSSVEDVVDEREHRIKTDGNQENGEKEISRHMSRGLAPIPKVANLPTVENTNSESEEEKQITRHMSRGATPILNVPVLSGVEDFKNVSPNQEEEYDEAATDAEKDMSRHMSRGIVPIPQVPNLESVEDVEASLTEKETEEKQITRHMSRGAAPIASIPAISGVENFKSKAPNQELEKDLTRHMSRGMAPIPKIPDLTSVENVDVAIDEKNGEKLDDRTLDEEDQKHITRHMSRGATPILNVPVISGVENFKNKAPDQSLEKEMSRHMSRGLAPIPKVANLPTVENTNSGSEEEKQITRHMSRGATPILNVPVLSGVEDFKNVSPNQEEEYDEAATDAEKDMSRHMSRGIVPIPQVPNLESVEDVEASLTEKETEEKQVTRHMSRGATPIANIPTISGVENFKSKAPNQEVEKDMTRHMSRGMSPIPNLPNLTSVDDKEMELDEEPKLVVSNRNQSAVEPSPNSEGVEMSRQISQASAPAPNLRISTTVDTFETSSQKSPRGFGFRGRRTKTSNATASNRHSRFKRFLTRATRPRTKSQDTLSLDEQRKRTSSQQNQLPEWHPNSPNYMEPRIDYELFVRMLVSSVHNTIGDPSKLGSVYQDMTKPLSHYFISSSHNSYLSGNQLNSESTSHAISRALKLGVRVIELDAWNGPNDEPIVTHGNTLCKPMSFIDCLHALKEFGFVASEYPVIITIENHCSMELQLKQVQYMEEILGDQLYKFPTPDPSNLKVGVSEWKSPAELRFKFVIRDRPNKRLTSKDKNYIKERRIRAESSRAEKSSSSDMIYKSSSKETSIHENENEGDGDGEEEGTPLLSDQNDGEENEEKTEGNAVIDEKFHVGQEQVNEELLELEIDDEEDEVESFQTKSYDPQKDGVSPRLLKLMYIKNVSIPLRKIGQELVEYESPNYCTSSSLSEQKMRKLATPGARAAALNSYAKKHLIRVFPAGSRIASSNYDPVPAWNAGCQIVALNYQSFGTEVWLNQGKFSDNGGCGYVLKPTKMLEAVTTGVVQAGSPRRTDMTMSSSGTFASRSESLSPEKDEPSPGAEEQEEEIEEMDLPKGKGTLDNKSSAGSLRSKGTRSKAAKLFGHDSIRFDVNQMNLPWYLNPGDASMALNPTIVHVHLISGHYLPKPSSSSNVSPYVEITLRGLVQDDKTVRSTWVENNGFNPVWRETFTFHMHNRDLSLLSFVVRSVDNGRGKGKFVAQTALPVSCIRPGLRCIPLRYANCAIADDSYLFCRIVFKDP